MVMSFMVASLRSGKEIEFDDMKCVETSFPGFFSLMKKWRKKGSLEGLELQSNSFN